MNFQWAKNYKLIISGVILIGLLLFILSAPIVQADFEISTDKLYDLRIEDKKYIYLLHHLFCFLPVFIISLLFPFFSTRWSFYKAWTFPIVGVSILFVIWDIIFSRLGVWGFNQEHLLGIGIINFPIEELLWFPIIGYCSLFIHALVAKSKLKLRNYWWVIILIILTMIGFIGSYQDRFYTAFSAWVVLITIWLFYALKMEDLFDKFFVSFGVILIPMILADGYLTGMFTDQATVQYNPLEFSGIRLISIPIEDFFFGFAFLAIIVLFKSVLNRRFSAV
ncbi:MAG: lycopene cyclase domain-containing protein [Saprospiraceae bacterium]